MGSVPCYCSAINSGALNKSRRDLGAHSNPGEVAFQFDGLHLILEKLLCGKAYSRGVSFLENILK